MAWITHDGIKLAYDDSGEGEPVFVFVHGWTCNRSFFAPQTEHFSRLHRVVSVDLRGHGESDKPRGAYPIAAYADDIACMIQRLGLGRTVAVGHSMGGLAVLQLAAACPECVAAIVMIEPAPFVSSPERRVAVEVLLSTIEDGDQEKRRQLLRQRYFLPTSDRKTVEEVLDIMMAAPDHVAINAMRGIEEFDALGAAARCTVPALHVAATPPLNPPHIMSEWLPHVVNGWTVGAGHFNQLEAPDQVNAMIEGFLIHHV